MDDTPTPRRDPDRAEGSQDPSDPRGTRVEPGRHPGPVAGYGVDPRVADPAAAPAPAPIGGNDDPRTLAAVLESAPDAIVIFDAESRIADWNPAAEQLLGHRRSQAIGKNVVELVFPNHLRAAIAGVIESRATAWGTPDRRRIEVTALTARGDEVPIELTLSWASGSQFFAAHMTDVSRRGERERELAADANRRTSLLTLGQRALTGAPLDELMAQTLDTAARQVGFDRCEIWECRPDDSLRLRVGHRSEGVDRVLQPNPASRIGWALAAGGLRAIAGGGHGRGSASVVDSDFGMAVAIPGPEGPFGVINGVSSAFDDYSAADLAHLESLAQLLASAIERDRYERSLAEAEARVRSLIERLPSITYQAGLGYSGRWYFISPQVEEILGYTVEECLSDDRWWERNVHPDDVDGVIAAEDRCVSEGGPLDVEYRMRTRDGRTIWIRDRASKPRPGSDGQMVVEGLLTDVTAQKLAEEKLQHLVDHDELTGLLNRRAFEAELERRLDLGAAHRGGAVALIDLDHMKRVNDALGHDAGDSLICEIAEILRTSVRPEDVVARLSADEFALLLDGLDEGTACARVQVLLKKVRRRDGGMMLTASGGLAMLGDGSSIAAADLLVAADVAMHQAKEHGRDRIAVFSGPDQRRLEWVGQVRAAIEEGRLELYAQPIFAVGDGRPHSRELLVRMVDEDGQVVPAAQFVPTAERFGLIRNLDRWVVSRAVELAGDGNPVSVNVSAASLADTDLVDLVERRLQAGGNTDPSLLTFEITETHATPTVESLQRFAQAVERVGCRLSLDDVGTGFGSFTYLQHVAFSELKIDMQFVRGIVDSASDARIVRSLIAVAREMGLKTVAEGVEDTEVLDELRRLGVDYAQGYLLGRPGPV